MRRFPTPAPPHLAPISDTGQIMRRVLWALLPGIAALASQFGAGVLIQSFIALTAALVAEAWVLNLRGRPILPTLADGSAALTALLLAVSLPPLAPWWLTLLGTAFAIIVGKQLYGGLGYNPFNPAMVGYAMLLVSFPRHLTGWLPPVDLHPAPLDFAAAWDAIFVPGFDALTMATPLDTTKTQLGLGRDLDEIHSAAVFTSGAWAWVNLGFLAGGLWLLWRKVIDWRIPASVIGGLFGTSLMCFLLDPAHYPTPLFQLLSGATMLGAFFIATDPVSAATTPKGRLIYGFGIGVLMFVIRAWGGYPDGVAFAVLLLNLAAPTIDHYTRPRVFGTSR